MIIYEHEKTTSVPKVSMQETASAFSTKTLFINLKVYSSKTKKRSNSSNKQWHLRLLWQNGRGPSSNFHRPHQFDHRFSGLWLATWEKSAPAPLNCQEPRRPQSKGDLDVGCWSGLNILEIFFLVFLMSIYFLLCRMYLGPFWWFWSWEVSVAIGIYTIALWGLIWLLKNVEERLWMFQGCRAEKLRNFRSNSPTEPAQQRNLENRISQLLWQLLWYPGSWVTFIFGGQVDTTSTPLVG